MPIKILLIDDDKNYFMLVRRMLSRDASQFQIDWASDYEMAKTIALNSPYDVFLVDLQLGNRNGLDLVRELLASGIQSPFIMLTGYTEDELELPILETGASDYINKSELKSASLRRTIRYAMQRTQDLKALKASEENYRSLLEDASDGILITDPEAKIILINSSVSEMIGEPQEAIVGKALTDFIVPANKAHVPLNPATMPTDAPVLVEHLLRTANGNIPVEISAKLVSGGRLQCFIRDISKRKEEEEERERYIQQLTLLQQVDIELNHMLNIDYVLSLALDAAVRLSAANAGFIATIDNGSLKLAQAIGRYGDLLPGDSLPENALIDQVLQDQQPRIFLDLANEPNYHAIIPDTSALMLIPLVSYERVLGILNLETRKVNRFTPEVLDFLKLIASRVAVAIENAQLYQIAQEQLARLQELYLQVSDLEKLKTDMIRIAAHDLRNPVGVIVGYLELLEWSLGDKISEKQKSQLEAMMRAAQRMEKITRDILSLERIEKLHLEKTQRLTLNPLLLEVFDDYRTQAAEKNQTYTLEISETALTVQADSAQMREAMANMVNNAIKYTPEDGSVTVKLRDESGMAIFEVVDTGFGIPEDQQVGLFQPFYRASSEETVNIEGTGLGLHLVKNIITRHDGKMIFESVYGSGSTFGFKLPLL